MPWWKRLPFFYGWVIVAAAFSCYAMGYTTWNSFSIFYVAILEEFGWSRAATAAAFSIFTLVYGFASLATGGLVDRFGPRLAFPLAGLLLGLGLALSARMTTLWEFYLVFGVVAALGLSGFGAVPTFTVLSHWFVRRLGAATGLAASGVGVGTLLLVPLLQVIITGHGWRTAYLALAAATVLVVPLLAFTLLRRRPQDLHLLPDGEEPGARVATIRARQLKAESLLVDKEWASRNWALGSALRTARFWLALFGRFLEMACLQVAIVHQAAFLVDMGYDRLLAASVVGTVGIVGSGGKILWGFLSDRIGRETSYFLAFGAGTVALAILLSIRPGSPLWMPYAYGIAYGLCYGSSAVLFPTLVADLFQGRHLGSILGGAYWGHGLGAATGAFLGGYVYDLTRSYTLAFALVIPAMWLACLLFWLAAPRKVRMVAGRAGV